jgi:HD-like signal output (HDOD) protein
MAITMKQPTTHVTTKELRRFNPLKNLPSRALEYISGRTITERLEAVTFVENGNSCRDEIWYLLHGEAELEGQDGTRTRVVAGSMRSTFPLVVNHSDTRLVRPNEFAVVIKMPRDILDGILHHPQDGRKSHAISHKEQQNRKLESDIFWEFHEAAKDNRLELPSLPDIAIRIAKVVNDPDTGSRDIAKVIQADPTLSARLIRIVNSPAYRGRQQINSLTDTVSRLGRNVTHNLVTSFVLGSLFRTRLRPLQQRMTSIWNHACQVAAISHELGRVTPKMSPDQAMLSGLLHEIGALPILNAVRNRPEVSEDPALLDHLLYKLKAEVGALVLKSWSFPQEFLEVVLHAEDWMYDDSTEPRYVDLVIVAKLHSHIGTPMMEHLPALDSVPAFRKLALGQLTPRHSLAILDNARESIEAMQRLLSGE